MMVTGDSKETALAIAQCCGIIGGEDKSEACVDNNVLGNKNKDTDNTLEAAVVTTMSSSKIDSIPPQNLANSTSVIRVFYKVVPRHKLLIVSALQKHSYIIAMTGNGVNDATTIKGADIGITMGRKRYRRSENSSRRGSCQ